MMKRKLAIPILLILSLSILSQTIIPSPAGYDSPAIYIEAVDYTDPDLTKTPGRIHSRHLGLVNPHVRDVIRP